MTIDTTIMDDCVFPTAMSWESSFGPDWLTEIAEKGSGREERNSPWAMPRREYDARYSVRTAAEIYQILQLYYAAAGRLRGFRVKDWTDYRSASPQNAPTMLDQTLGTGDGVTTLFNLIKRYNFASRNFDRRITRPVAGTVLVAKDGVNQAAGWTLNAAGGTITFAVAPALGAALKWGGEFHVPCRFDGKLTNIAVHGPIESIPSIPLVELKED
jgi:uncharacterized protein (TIGR02217 family)